jgi:hypothetical protein
LDAERFLRQLVLPEIGEAGQRAIGAGTAHVLGATGAHEVARVYAQRAGFEKLAEAPAALDAGVPEDWIEAPAAREVLAGARAAARAIVAALPRDGAMP